MTDIHEPWPGGATLTLRLDPEPGFRAELARRIHAFHGETVPYAATRFGLALQAPDGTLRAGFSGVMSWGWLFVEAVWVEDALRGTGTGRRLMARAEAYAAAAGCHSAWLDPSRRKDFTCRSAMSASACWRIIRRGSAGVFFASGWLPQLWFNQESVRPNGIRPQSGRRLRAKNNAAPRGWYRAGSPAGSRG